MCRWPCSSRTGTAGGHLRAPWRPCSPTVVWHMEWLLPPLQPLAIHVSFHHTQPSLPIGKRTLIGCWPHEMLSDLLAQVAQCCGPYLFREEGMVGGQRKAMGDSFPVVVFSLAQELVVARTMCPEA